MRIGSGSTIDAMPAIQQPRTIVISALLVGPRMATWSPGIRPRACSAAPTTLASSWISRHDTNRGSPPGATDAPTKVTPLPLSAATSRRSIVDEVTNPRVVAGRADGREEALDAEFRRGARGQ